VAKLSQVDHLKYYPVFAVSVLVLAIAMSQVVNVVTDRTLLPVVYPVAQGSEPLSVTNNDGTLSNGDRLRGWPKVVYFGGSAIAWLAACGITFVALVRVWPAKERA